MKIKNLCAAPSGHTPKGQGSSETTREITILKKDFYNWWIGFLEGDGSFFIRSNNTLGFEISQKTTDSQVLYYIKKNLGFGQVNHNFKKCREVESGKKIVTGVC